MRRANNRFQKVIVENDPSVLIYSNCRYTADTSPSTIYIPSVEVMFKIMRACIGITNVNDIWIN